MIDFPPQAESGINWLRTTPIAHRGLHNASLGIFENTLSACRAAKRQGYSIEVDLQPSADCEPFVFHDYTLERMTPRSGNIRDMLAREVITTPVMDSEDKIPPLSELLNLIDGKVGIVLELKGKHGKDEGFAAAVAEKLKDYDGYVAVMSFYHHILDDFREHAPDILLGLTAEGDDILYDIHRTAAERNEVDFVSYELSNLDCQFVREFKETGRPVISWTARTKEDAAFSSKFADQPTFEGFLA
ncbi:MAG: glycerophosphodiester phosphodiesterase family protein [Pseudomonadota bacterium]